MWKIFSKTAFISDDILDDSATKWREAINGEQDCKISSAPLIFLQGNCKHKKNAGLHDSLLSIKIIKQLTCINFSNTWFSHKDIICSGETYFNLNI